MSTKAKAKKPKRKSAAAKRRAEIAQLAAQVQALTEKVDAVLAMVCEPVPPVREVDEDEPALRQRPNGLAKRSGSLFN